MTNPAVPGGSMPNISMRHDPKPERLYNNQEDKMNRELITMLAIEIAAENYHSDYYNLSEDLQAKVLAQAEEDYNNKRADEAEAWGHARDRY